MNICLFSTVLVFLVSSFSSAAEFHNAQLLLLVICSVILKNISLEMMSDGLDDLLSQAVDQYEKEEVVLDDGFNEIFSQSLDMFEKKSLKTTLSILPTCLRLAGLVW